MFDQLRQIVARATAIDTARLDPQADLYDRGLTSHGTVQLMLQLEDAFGVEFPDELLKKETFTSLQSIAGALASMGVEASSPS
ncbi:acyl carrier protein [Acidimicrobiaceae bacterium USS-CC1]|uniref:Acyl carrier protein n=1 Tax=Acidiferrimicrobium australe TaxID=2664430 RepID=A0ABW9QTL8_9ACTN|nr:acyl carrier protein [Acidiferrimicrobium australe]